eukprot:2475713-Amphidinium_carterae.1
MSCTSAEQTNQPCMSCELEATAARAQMFIQWMMGQVQRFLSVRCVAHVTCLRRDKTSALMS